MDSVGIDASLFDLSFFEGDDNSSNVWNDADRVENGSVGSSSTSGEENVFDEYSLLSFIDDDANKHAPSPLKLVQTVAVMSPRRPRATKKVQQSHDGKPTKTKTKRVRRTKEERKQRRREKQRVIARNFRKRKKAHLQNLQEEVKLLRLENEKFRKELGLSVKGAEEDVERETKRQRVQNLKTMLKSGEESAVRDVVSSIKSEERLRAEKETKSVRFHLNELRRHLDLPKQTKMILLGLQHEKQSSAESGEANEETTCTSSPEAMWSLMETSLSLSAKQRASLQAKRVETTKLFDEYAKIQNDFATFSKRVAGVLSRTRQTASDVSDLLTPLQHGQHLVWREQNKACLQMVDYMWKAKLEAAVKK